MSGKSKRKHVVKSKKKRASPQYPAVNVTHDVMPQEVTKPAEPVIAAKASAPAAEAPSQIATMAAARYPYVKTELKRIGILAGIILVILVVLALILT